MNELRPVCGDPSLPGDLTEIPEPRPSGWCTQVQYMEAARGYQGSVWCDGYQVHFGPIRNTVPEATQDADKACDEIRTKITDGLMEDLAHKAWPAKLD